MTSRALEVLRAATGVDGPELAVAVGALTLDQLAAVTEDILQGPTSAPLVAPPRSEVWPLVTLRASTFAAGGMYRDAAGPAGLNLNAALNPRLAGTGRFSDAVLRALLYCHGLVIEDPIAAAAEMYQSTRREVRQVAQLAVVSATASAVEIAPLLDDDIISTFFTSSAQQADVSRLGSAISARLSASNAGYSIADAWDAFESSYVEGLTPSLQQLWRRVRSGDRSPPMELLEQGLVEGDAAVVETFVEVLKNLRPQAVIENATEMVASAVLAVEGLGGFHDLLCPSALFANLLFLGSPDPAHEVRLHELGRVDVPGLAQLGVADAVRIRQGSGAFAEWRTHLSEALTYAEDLRKSIGAEADTTAVVRDVIADARAALHREARNSSLFTLTNALSFVAGSLGGTVAGAPGGLTGAAFGATGGALGPLVQLVLNAKRVPGYLDRHYLVFERQSN